MSGRHIGGIVAIVAAVGFFLYFVLGYWHAATQVADPQLHWNTLLSQLIVPLGLLIFGVWLLTIKKKTA
ncbi:MAG: hypothetical protein AB7O59_11620 [Pirellulales bacterium]